MASNNRKRINPAVEATSAAAANAGQKPRPADEIIKTTDEDLVTVTIPTAFTLSLDDYSQVKYEVGTKDVPRSHAEHWFSKANGMKIHEKKD